MAFVAICRERFFCVLSVQKLRPLSENFIPEILDMISYKCANVAFYQIPF